MKICWDNLEKIYLTRNGNLKHINGHIYYEKICKNCNKEYLGEINQYFCTPKCHNSGKYNPRINKTHSEESKQKMSKAKKAENHWKWKQGKTLCWFDTYASRISFAEEVRRALDNENILEVKCKYCGKWFKPTRQQINHRINSLDENDGRYFYCSEECKSICPIFHKHKYPVGFLGDQNSSREVQPELRKMVLERDNYTCQKCGLNSNNSCVELHCHHIDPVKSNPIESADMDNCITLCKDCHLEAHQKDGCKTGQLANC